MLAWISNALLFGVAFGVVFALVWTFLRRRSKT